MNKLDNIFSKIQSIEKAKATVLSWKEADEIVVFTNGCFDILHQGHVTYLAESANLGTKLVLALNSDASVKRLDKGDERPINPESARALVMASLEVVDLVVFFDNDTPLLVIETLLPNVLVKGGDYDANETDPTQKKYIVGKKEVEKSGGKVATIDLVAGFSTTAIVNKLKR